MMVSMVSMPAEYLVITVLQGAAVGKREDVCLCLQSI